MTTNLKHCFILSSISCIGMDKREVFMISLHSKPFYDCQKVSQHIEHNNNGYSAWIDAVVSSYRRYVSSLSFMHGTVKYHFEAQNANIEAKTEILEIDVALSVIVFRYGE
uniref:Uncharacterized protein n=1 Tax=Glossina austeni TaxID=7395 RepID=A0A1A9VGS4_GLOAU